MTAKLGASTQLLAPVDACGDSLQWSFVRSEAVQHQAMLELQKKGVALHRWPDKASSTRPCTRR